MKNRKVLVIVVVIIMTLFTMAACSDKTNNQKDIDKTLEVGNELVKNQPTPTDINYSLERYNLIRRAYWVNGQREKAINLPCPVVKPLGYIVLLTPSGAVLGRFIVDGKITSLNSYLTPDSEYYEKVSGSANSNTASNKWLPDVDGAYGFNDNGIFFFTPNGQYIEWNGLYIYSDIPFEIENPILITGGSN